jgi:hypothetical protein
MAIARATVPQNTASAVYTSSGDTAISNAYFCNYSGTGVTIDVYIVPAAGTAADTNRIYKSLSIPAGDTYVMDQEKLVFGAGEMLQISCSAASSVTATISYVSI